MVEKDIINIIREELKLYSGVDLECRVSRYRQHEYEIARQTLNLLLLKIEDVVINEAVAASKKTLTLEDFISLYEASLTIYDYRRMFKALKEGRSVHLYGPPFSGKTTIATALREAGFVKVTEAGDWGYGPEFIPTIESGNEFPVCVHTCTGYEGPYTYLDFSLIGEKIRKYIMEVNII